MFLKDYLSKYKDKKIKLLVDMDGVIADYNVGFPGDYDKKRPLFSSIEKLEEISHMENVELYIFSATRLNNGIEQKHYWLDKFCPFFKKENRIILSREQNNMMPSSTMKSNYLRDYPREENTVIILIDDDPKNLFEVKSTSPDVILLKDTVLVD